MNSKRTFSLFSATIVARGVAIFAILVTVNCSATGLAQTEFPDVEIPLFKNVEEIPANFRRQNLVAWCIVPFDSKERSPEERAEMLVRLGMKKCAYDWRKKHIPTFEREIVAYQKNEIEFTAFWSQHDEAFRLFKKHEIKPQVWLMMKQPKAADQTSKVAEAIAELTPLAENCRAMECKLGLYNHGGWAGEPANLVAVAQGLHAAGFPDVGIVYNFHHAHDRILDAEKFTKSLELMKPMLMCLNLNGMVDHSGLDAKQQREQKIRAIGSGDFEAAMISAVIKSKYNGPIGVLGHVNTRDVENVLKQNLEGLEYILGSRDKPDWLAKSDEAKYMSKWTPKARDDSKFPYEQEKDPDWDTDRASKMDNGLTYNHSIKVPTKKDETGAVTESKMFVKAIAVKAGGNLSNSHLLFDTQQLNVTATWTGDFIGISPARFGILKMPTVSGDVDWVARKDLRWQIANEQSGKFTPVADAQSRFIGSHQANKFPGCFDYSIAGTSIRDLQASVTSTENEPDMMVRCWIRSPSIANLRVPLRRIKKLVQDRTHKNGAKTSLLLEEVEGGMLYASSGFELVVEDNVLYACLPPSTVPVSKGIILAACDKKTAGKFDGAYNKIAEDFLPSTDDGVSYPKNRWGKPISAGPTNADVSTSNGETDSTFVVETIPVPLENQHNALMFTSGFDFVDAKRAFVCTVHGDVWLVDGLNAEDLNKVTWKRFATGLYQPLGLKVVDGKPIVMCRDRLTRLHDFNDDNEADFYENFNDDLHVTGQNHAYAMSLETDPDGNFFFIKSGGSAPHGGTMLKLSSDGNRLTVHATGYRHANGLGVSPTGIVTSADNEGNWIPATRIDMVERGGFYGHMPTHRRESKPEKYDEPLVWIPRSIDNSAGGQTWVPENNKAWAPLAGKMIHFSFGRCTANVVLPQKIGNVNQAAIYRLDIPRFLSGSMRGRFNPHDGSLYVCGLDGWQTAAVQDGHFQRVSASGKSFYQPTDFSAHKNRIEISFDTPLNPENVKDLEKWTVQQWNYRWTQNYGSDHYSVKAPEQVGHDDVAVEKVELSNDGKRVSLFIDDLKPVMQMAIRANLVAADGHELNLEVFNTIHALAD